MHYPQRLFSRFFPAFAMLLLAWPAQSQEVTAAINGVVTDPSGAAIVGAKVTAKDLDRGTVYPTTTDSVGRYNIPRVAVGTYEVRAESPGFQVVAAITHRSCAQPNCQN